MLRQIKLVCAAAIASAIMVSGASAQGLADTHTQVRVGNKICMADHYHSGSSNGHPSRKAAEAAAISSWAGFTAWEYGSNWGHFALAESKRIVCQNVGGWGCTLDARPCRPADNRGRRR